MSHDHSQNHYGPNASFDGHDSDLASAGILIESLRQQLAAALAVCKQKDEGLEKIRGHIGLYNLFSCVGSDSYDPECADLNVGKCIEIAIEALTIQPDDTALMEWGARLLEKVAKEDFDDCGEYSGEDIRLIANRLRNGEWKP